MSAFICYLGIHRVYDEYRCQYTMLLYSIDSIICTSKHGVCIFRHIFI